ncbi:PRC-barrel domain-containing protein [Portibacter lacus]|uniref:PRC-barrel domain-containing protein n=1 Tax=Portibacter lacus TaxID=1099794 RepID=A0AA37WF47_9BACT|nr:PRC-barrel domain-containing protein [Portibacter lacus]GLR17369.1 hypothetical protein GCM10007940_19840 [Portibacter lacus]
MQSIKNKFRKLENYSNVQEHDQAIDIRGFKVQAGPNLIIGKVESLIVDDRTDLVRYIEVNTKDFLDSPLNDDNKYRKDEKYTDRFEGGAHYLLIPIGLATIDSDNFLVNVVGLHVENIYTGPRHRQDFEVNEDYEYKVVSKFVQNKDSEFLSKYNTFQNEQAVGLDNHFYQRDYFKTRRSEKGKPNSPML